MFDSVYTATYDPSSQTVSLHDVVSDIYTALEYWQFQNQTLNYFGPERTERIMLSLTCGRTLTISWVDSKAGFRSHKIDPFHHILKSSFNPDNIQAELDMASAYDHESLEEHRRRLVTDLTEVY